MADRFAAAPTASDLIVLHQRFPGDRIGGAAGTLGNGVLAELAARYDSRVDAAGAVEFQVAGAGVGERATGARSYVLHVFDGAPESNSAWESGPGAVFTLDAPPRPALAATPRRSSVPYVLIVVAVVVAALVFGGKR